MFFPRYSSCRCGYQSTLICRFEDDGGHNQNWNDPLLYLIFGARRGTNQQQLKKEKHFWKEKHNLLWAVTGQWLLAHLQTSEWIGYSRNWWASAARNDAGIFLFDKKNKRFRYFSIEWTRRVWINYCTFARWSRPIRCVRRDYLEQWCAHHRSKRKLLQGGIPQRSILPRARKTLNWVDRYTTLLEHIFEFTWKMRLDGSCWFPNGCQTSISL